MPEFEFDVALSFAGEDRVFVDRVAKILRDNGTRVFYDEFEVLTLWGLDLYTVLDDVYRHKSRYAVVFASENYSRKMWTSHERRSAQARALQEKESYLLPVRLDNSLVPGLRPTIGYIDGSIRGPEEVAKLIIAKIGLPASADTGPAPEVTDATLQGVPLTPEEKQAIMSTRPRGWEYLLLAGGIWQGVQELVPKRLDHELRYARATDRYVNRDGVMAFSQQSIDQFTNLVGKIMNVVRKESQDWALGANGGPGDPTRINHLTKRFATAYEELLDWAADVRGTACPEECRRLLELIARFADEPVAKINEFAERIVVEASRIPAHVASGTDEVLSITLELRFDGDNALVAEFGRELERLDH
nr:TIR domain-containing protein [Micromonospora sp. DSM 115978]